MHPERPLASAALYARIPVKVYEALKLEAERRASTLSRTTAELLTAALVSQAAPSLVPTEVEAYLTGRRMFAVLAGFLEAANKEEDEPDAS
jgi:hypothetical protein